MGRRRDRDSWWMAGMVVVAALLAARPFHVTVPRPCPPESEVFLEWNESRSSSQLPNGEGTSFVLQGSDRVATYRITRFPGGYNNTPQIAEGVIDRAQVEKLVVPLDRPGMWVRMEKSVNYSLVTYRGTFKHRRTLHRIQLFGADMNPQLVSYLDASLVGQCYRQLVGRQTEAPHDYSLDLQELRN